MSTTKKSWRDVVKIHPAAEVFPALSADELTELARDIKANTLQNPVALWEQLTPEGPVVYLLDGRNRLDAMEKAGIPVLNPEGTALQEHLVGKQTLSMSSMTAGAVVVGLNVHRRHLTPSQRAKLAAKAILADQEFLAKLNEKAPVEKPQVKPDAQECAAGHDDQGRRVKGTPPANKSIVAEVAKTAGVHRNTARKAVADAKAEANGQAPKAKTTTKKKATTKADRANTSKRTAVDDLGLHDAELGTAIKALGRRKPGEVTDKEVDVMRQVVLHLRTHAEGLTSLLKIHDKPKETVKA